MLTRSPAFDQAVIHGAPVVVTAYVTRGGLTLTELDLLPGATVTMDDTAASRRTFSGHVANDGTLAPHFASDPLAPYGIELVVSTGLVLNAPTAYSQPVVTANGLAGHLESIPEGVFRINVVSDDSAGLISLSGPDRSAVVAAALNEKPYQIAAGTPLDVAIGNYLATKYPALPFLPDGAAHSMVLGATVIYQTGTSSGDPWSNMQDLAANFYRELFIDNLGRAVLRPIPNPATWPVSWTFLPGTANLVTSGSHTMDTSQGVFNVVVVSNGSTGTAIPGGVLSTVSVEITDPTSPIYPNPNGFGRRPLFFATQHLTSNDDLTALASALLNQRIGAHDQVSFTAVPHPCLEPSDVVNFTSQRLGLQQALVLSSWSLQLDMQGASSYTTRTAGAQQEILVTDLANLL